jgi:5-methylthioadenosine/S-adenosylhomocysteine deaminase
MKILTANYVLPIAESPIEQGGVAIVGSEIVAVGRREDIIEQFPAAETEDFGEAAILPGFVNCHSHLEITSMRGALDDVEHDFSAWLLKLNDMRSKMSEQDICNAAIAGAVEGIRAGVTCFGDIGRYGAAGFEALKTVGVRGVLFQETEFSADDATAESDFEKLIEKFEALRTTETELVKVGISPHSPYTVSPRFFRLIADHAVDNNIRITIHVAESGDEEDLLRNGAGFFREVYKKYGVAWRSPNCSAVEYLDRLGVLQARPLLAHCVTVSDSDIDLIAKSNAAIAHCPKSNAKFGHGYAPLEKFLGASIAVGLGSDSVASNNVCDMLEESRFAVLAARNRSDSERFISAREMLEAATIGGARALQLDDEMGTLEAGKQADIAVVSLAHAAQQPIHDIHTALVFSTNARDVVMTMVAGSEIFRKKTDSYIS